ncbi:hypothetical protein CRUP_038096, partial [Coryphaenoides rupestris]
MSLCSLLEKIEQETWRESGISFVTSVTRLMERLLDYRDCMKGDETENKRIGCTVNLLNFYKSEINKDEMYVRYVHKLCDMYLQAHNYTESSPCSMSRSTTTRVSAGSGIGFYGRKFPFFLRNKEFVCRGYDYERLEAFQQRMLGEFPQAIAMQHPNQPDEAILQCDAQCILFTCVCVCVCVRQRDEYHDVHEVIIRGAGSLTQGPKDLQIYAVTPVPENLGVLQMDRVPERIKSFYRVNNVRRFRYDRPFHKGPKDKDNEFKVEVSPLQNALEVVESKNQELRSLIGQYQLQQLHSNVSLFSMTLNGVIDAAVNGGVARYQEAFFDKEYLSNHPEDTDKITQLKDLMQDQVHILGLGLAVHEKLVHPEMRPLHKKLIDQFHVMRTGLCL